MADIQQRASGHRGVQFTALALREGTVVSDMAGQILAGIEKHFWGVAVSFLAVFLACCIAEDIHKKMWIDELYTLRIAQQVSPAEIVRATLEGSDNAPPLYAILVHTLLPWVRPDELAVRLPSTVGYCGMILCLMAFSRRRWPAVYSLIAALLACNAGFVFATEGRPYGLMLGFAAGALVFWQAAVDGRRRNLAVPLLAVCIALMVACHYFAIFFLAPLLLAEVVRKRSSGKLDFPVLAAITSGFLVLGLHYPLIHAATGFQAHYWSPALWNMVPPLYFSLFADMCLIPVICLAVFWKTSGRTAMAHSGLTPPEWAAAATCAVMPLAIFVLSRYSTHMFVDRYTLWAVLGIAVLATGMLYVAANNKAAVGVSTLGVLVALIFIREAYTLHQPSALLEGEGIREELTDLPDSSEPVVIADHHVFMELSYYAPPRLRERLIYPLSRDLDLRYFYFDTGALLMSALRHRSRLNIIDYDAVLAGHPRFILAALYYDYLPWHLVRTGYRVIPITRVKSVREPMLYEVEKINIGVPSRGSPAVSK